MKNLPSLLSRAVLALTGALALGACSRSTYSFNNTAPAYLGPAPVAATHQRPQSAAPAATPGSVAVPTAEAPEAIAAPATRPVTVAPADSRPVAAAPVASAAPVALPEAAAPARPSLAQRLVLKKLTKKLDKLAAQTPQLRQHDAAASTSRTDGGLRQALVLGVIGLAIILLGALLNIGIIYVIGVIVIIIALVLLLLYLINQM